MRRDSEVWKQAERLLRETSLSYKEIGARIGRTGQAVSVYCRQKKLRELDYLNRPDREITMEFVEDCRRLAALGDVKPVIADKLGCNLRDVFRALVGDEWINSVFGSPAKRQRRAGVVAEKEVSSKAEAWLRVDYLPYKNGSWVRCDHLAGFISSSAVWVEPGETRPLFCVPVFLRVTRADGVQRRGVYRWGSIRQNAERVAGGKLAGAVGPTALWEYSPAAAVVGVAEVSAAKKKPP